MTIGDLIAQYDGVVVRKDDLTLSFLDGYWEIHKSFRVHRSYELLMKTASADEAAQFFADQLDHRLAMAGVL